MRPGFSIDNEVSYGTDMFTEMRVAFNVQRAMATYRKVNGDAKAPALVSVRDVLECATAGGAACAGLLDKCGTLTPGKEADIVMIRTDDINLYPSNHAIGTVVSAADMRNIDTVIIGGRIRKLARPDGGREHGQVPSDGRRIAQRICSRRPATSSISSRRAVQHKGDRRQFSASFLARLHGFN